MRTKTHDRSSSGAGRARGVAAVLLAVPALIVAGCDESSTDPIDTVSWTATLAGEGEYEEVGGEADATSTATSFEIEVAIADAAADGEYTWRVAGGTCEAPGDIVGEAGDYPAIETDGEGAGSAEADVTAVLDPDEDYHVSIGVADDEETVVACGDLAAS